MRARLRSVLLVAGIMVFAGVGFVGVVGPLFKTSGPPRAELTGLYDTQLQTDRPTVLDVAVDNTGDSIIDPLCIGVVFDPPVDVTSMTFDNNFRYPIHNGKACGGSLVGKETINVTLQVMLRHSGSLHVSVTPFQDSTVIGTPLRATLTVSG